MNLREPAPRIAEALRGSMCNGLRSAVRTDSHVRKILQMPMFFEICARAARSRGVRGAVRERDDRALSARAFA